MLTFPKSNITADVILKHWNIPISRQRFDHHRKISPVDAISPSWSISPLKFWNFQNPTWRRPPSWKIEKSPYVSNCLTNHHEIWHDECFHWRLLVCHFVCLLVRTITSERLNIRRWNLAIWCDIQKSRPSTNVKVKGQRSRSPGTKKENVLSHPHWQCMVRWRVRCRPYSMVDIRPQTAENRRRKKERRRKKKQKKPHDENTQGGHKKEEETTGVKHNGLPISLLYVWAVMIRLCTAKDLTAVFHCACAETTTCDHASKSWHNFVDRDSLHF